MTEDFHSRPAQIVHPEGHMLDAEFHIWDAAPHDSHLVQLSIRFLDREIIKTDTNYFAAMKAVRMELEKDDLCLLCYGASRDVYPSSMSRDMGSGEKAYRLRLGEQAQIKDIISIFDSGPDVIYATVAEQEDYFQKWARSITN